MQFDYKSDMNLMQDKQNRNPPSRRRTRRGRESVSLSSLLCVESEDHWILSWLCGDEENRTGGLWLTTWETRATTTAPFHQFDVFKVIWKQYDGIEEFVTFSDVVEEAGLKALTPIACQTQNMYGMSEHVDLNP